jgi:hypothetical protein
MFTQCLWRTIAWKICGYQRIKKHDQKKVDIDYGK